MTRKTEETIKLAEERIQREADIRKRSAEEKALLQEQALVHLMQTKSWRWTAWLRKLEASARKLGANRIPYAIFGDLHVMWVSMGKPFPTLAHKIRYELLGRLWPVHQMQSTDDAPRVCAVILCTNTPRTLDKAIESVLTQTLKAADILVVDTTGKNEAAAIAALYAERNVRFMSGRWEHAGDSRNAGTAATSTPLIVYLTGETVLHQDYILCGVHCLQSNSQAGICYTDRYEFGPSKNLFKAPEPFDWKHFDAINHDGAVTMMRRSALLEAGGWDSGDGPESDRMTWHKILRTGHTAIKGKGLYSYASPEQL